MGLNLNLDLNRLPHIWQTLISMVVGGVFIGASFLVVGKKVESGNRTQREIKTTVESIDQRLMMVEYTQEKIIDSLASNRDFTMDMAGELSSDIEAVDSRMIYFIRHYKDMTQDQILDAFSLGYNSGLVEGKKNETIH